MTDNNYIKRFLEAGTRKLGIDCSILVGTVLEIRAQAESRVLGETVAEILAALPDELEKGTPRGNQDEYSLGFNEYRAKVLALLSSKQNPSSPPNEL